MEDTDNLASKYNILHEVLIHKSFPQRLGDYREIRLSVH